MSAAGDLARCLCGASVQVKARSVPRFALYLKCRTGHEITPGSVPVPDGLVLARSNYGYAVFAAAGASCLEPLT